MASDLSTLFLPQNNPVTLNVQGIDVYNTITLGNLVYPVNPNNVIPYVNPQPYNLVGTVSGSKTILGLNQSAYFSLFQGSFNIPTGSQTDLSMDIITPVTKQLNTLGYDVPTGILTIGITGYYKVDFAATVTIAATTTLTGTNIIGIGGVGIGIQVFSTLNNASLVSVVQVIPISNSCILKLTAGNTFSMQYTTNSDKAISLTDISFNLVLIDSASP